MSSRVVTPRLTSCACVPVGGPHFRESPRVHELQVVRADHGPAISAFELEHRASFIESISDRDDDDFDRCEERRSELLAEQEAGIDTSDVLVDEDGSVVGRFNLYRTKDGAAEVGDRAARRVAGRRVATAAVRERCQLAASRHGPCTLRAATSDQNVASQRVLMKAGGSCGSAALRPVSRPARSYGARR